MQLTGTVELGQLLTIGSVVVSTIGAYYAIKGRMVVVERLVEEISREMRWMRERIEAHQVQLADLNAAVFERPNHNRRRGSD